MTAAPHHGVRYWADGQTCADFRSLLPGIEPSAAVRCTDGLQVTLPDLAPGDLVLPSFASRATGPWRFQCTLASVALPTVPSTPQPESTPSTVDHGAIATHLDWFEVREPLAQPVLQITAPAAALAASHLLTVSIRSVHIAAAAAAVTAVAAAQPPQISQLQAPAAIKGRICSPTALTMVLKHQQRQVAWLEFVEQCRDPATGMYGLWPLGIYRAAQAGSLGAVQTFSSWDAVAPLFAADIPVVASIRYPAGGLPGSPLPATAGHLVVVYGVDDDWVLVNDPAAPEHETVPRRYPRVAFERAWFEHRGAGYVLLPG